MSDARDTECEHISDYRLQLVSSIVLGRASPVVAGAITIVVFAALGNSLEAQDVFTTVAVFQSMRIALIMLPLAATNYVNIRSVLSRVQNFILPEETLESDLQSQPKTSTVQLDIAAPAPSNLSQTSCTRTSDPHTVIVWYSAP